MIDEKPKAKLEPETLPADALQEDAPAPAKRAPIWPLNDDGSICTPPPHIVPGFQDEQKPEQ